MSARRVCFVSLVVSTLISVLRPGCAPGFVFASNGGCVAEITSCGPNVSSLRLYNFRRGIEQREILNSDPTTLSLRWDNSRELIGRLREWLTISSIIQGMRSSFQRLLYLFRKQRLYPSLRRSIWLPPSVLRGGTGVRKYCC